jgi:CRP/FNR family transcriptional regulator
MLRGVISLADSMALKTVPSRVAMLLLEEANRMQPDGIAREFRLKLTQEDVAGIVGATRESVSRALGQLRAAGVIEQHGARIRIVDAEGLGCWAQNGVAAELTQPALRSLA